MKRAVYISVVVLLVLISFFIAVWAILQRIHVDKQRFELEYNRVLMDEERKECSIVVKDLNMKIDSLNNLVTELSDK